MCPNQDCQQPHELEDTCDISTMSYLSAGHQSDVEVVRWHPVCQYLATGSSDRSVRLWDMTSGQCVRIFVGHRAPVRHRLPAQTADCSQMCTQLLPGNLRWEKVATTCQCMLHLQITVPDFVPDGMTLAGT